MSHLTRAEKSRQNGADLTELSRAVYLDWRVAWPQSLMAQLFHSHAVLLHD